MNQALDFQAAIGFGLPTSARNQIFTLAEAASRESEADFLSGYLHDICVAIAAGSTTGPTGCAK